MKKLIPFILFASFLFCFSCNKSTTNIEQTLLEKYFDQNIIGQNFVVTLAKDSTTDLTSNYNGYTFILLKTDFYHGPLKAMKGSLEYDGTWQANSDYSKLTITLPTSVPVFQFLSRSWKFTKKDVPTLQLAPWGSSDPIVLYMTRQ